MGTREVYEERLRRGNLEHDPTINPGLGNPRCPRCLSLVNPHSVRLSLSPPPSFLSLPFPPPHFHQSHSPQENEEWTITPVLHDATAVAGCGIGGMLSAIHGIPFVQKHVKGPKWLPFIIGVPPLLICSAASAVFGGYALPKFTQLTVTSYYAASSASHYGISLLTRRIEEANTSHSPPKRIK
uniref:Gb protein n=1 Tax=Daucus carota subsp. sativus TaxID=79200 RepID=A0A164X6P9_DAUCS